MANDNREIINKEIIIKVPDERRTVKKAARRLGRMGFSNRSSRSRFALKGCFSETEIRKLRKYCKKKGFWIHVTDARYARNSGYRNVFFKDNPREKYKCAYCGKVLKKDNVTVDHILPVKMFRDNKSGMLLKFFRIRDVNDSRNLAPACRKCNRKKAHSAGFWSFRGFAGRSYFRRTVMNFFRLLIAGAVCLAIIVPGYFFIFADEVV